MNNAKQQYKAMMSNARKNRCGWLDSLPVEIRDLFCTQDTLSVRAPGQIAEACSRSRKYAQDKATGRVFSSFDMTPRIELGPYFFLKSAKQTTSRVEFVE